MKKLVNTIVGLFLCINCNSQNKISILYQGFDPKNYHRSIFIYDSTAKINEGIKENTTKYLMSKSGSNKIAKYLLYQVEYPKASDFEGDSYSYFISIDNNGFRRTFRIDHTNDVKRFFQNFKKFLQSSKNGIDLKLVKEIDLLLTELK